MDLGIFGSITLDPQFLSALLSIVIIDIILAGDNAVVIAMAVRSLPPDQRRKGILFGSGVAALLRVVLTFFVAQIRRSRLLLHPSKDEGGATVIVEALQSGTPVIAFDCDGNVGLLGRNYPGLFPVGDMRAARSLLLRAENEARFYRRLAAAARQRARLFTPALEGKTLRRLVHNSITLKMPKPK